MHAGNHHIQLSQHLIGEVERPVGEDVDFDPGKDADPALHFLIHCADVPHVLELVGLTDKIWNFPHELSGGEQQRVAIARAIVNQPDVLLADEPTGNLDPINAHDVTEILKKINDLGTTVLLTTHNKTVVDSIGRRVVTMDQGRIVRDDKHGKYVL